MQQASTTTLQSILIMANSLIVNVPDHVSTDVLSSYKDVTAHCLITKKKVDVLVFIASLCLDFKIKLWIVSVSYNKYYCSAEKVVLK